VGADEAIDEATLTKLMEGDYDEEKFGIIMEDAFGEGYYNNNNKNDRNEDKEWRDNSEQDGLEQQQQGSTSTDDYNAFDGDEYQEGNRNAAGDNDQDWDGDGNNDTPHQHHHQHPLEKKISDRMEEELYKLDHEDVIGNMPTRFKYKKVEPNNYGLSSIEVLTARDSTLKQFVSLKKMAPYRDEENNGEYYGGVDGRMRPEGEYVPGTKKRKRFREMAKADILEDNRMKGKSEMSGDETKEIEGENMDGIRVEEAEMDKEGQQPETIKKKRRRQKKKKKDGVASVDDSNTGRSLSNSSKAKNDTATVHSDEVTKKQVDKVVPKENRKDDSKKNDVIHNEKDATKKNEENGIKKKESREENNGGEIKKKKKKTRKKKGTKVEGVSKSRLASYGL